MLSSKKNIKYGEHVEPLELVRNLILENAKYVAERSNSIRAASKTPVKPSTVNDTTPIMSKKQELQKLLENISRMQSSSSLSLTETDWSDEDSDAINELRAHYDNTTVKTTQIRRQPSTNQQVFHPIITPATESTQLTHIQQLEDCVPSIPLITPSSVFKVRQIKQRSNCSKLSPIESEQSIDHVVNLKVVSEEERCRNLTSDITVCLGDQSFPAHKLVLYNKSGYFRQLILHNDGNILTRVNLDPPISVSAFKILYDYMYADDMRLTHDDFEDVLVAANNLAILGAPHKMLEFLEKSFDLANVLLLYDYARNASDVELRAKANFLITSNFIYISEQLEFVKMPIETLIEILDDDGIVVASELDVFRTAIRWLAYDWEQRKVHCIELMSKVRFTIMSQEELLICYPEMERWGIIELGQMKDNMITILRYKMGQQIGVQLSLTNGFNFRRRNSMAEKMDELVRIHSSGDMTDNSPSGSSSACNLTSASLRIKNSPSIIILGGSNFIRGSKNEHLPDQNSVGNSMYHYVPGENLWKSVGVLPLPWHHPGTVQSRELIYICGGCVPSDNLLIRSPQATTMTWCFNTSDRKWQKLPDMVSARVYHTVLVWHEKIYAMGGINEMNKVLDTVECYDPLINMWKVVCRIPEARLGMAACTHQDLFWLCGGIIRSNKDQINGGVITATSFMYKPKTNTWYKTTPLRVARAFATLSVLNGRLVLVGGIGPSCRGAGLSASISDVDTFDLQRNEWRHLTDLFAPRHCCSAVVIGRFLYVIGGISSDGEALNTVEIFDSLRNSCPTFGINLPTKLAGMGSAVLPPNNA